ncbi:MAG: response regulator [Candidatus Syntrophoarchaeum sp.]|nr:response regulator [Methanomicrobia archaeon]MBL7118031.1 response regulator [Candidatus Syntrophoarchaeum sp.]
MIIQIMTKQNTVRILHVDDNPRAIQITRLYLEDKNNNFKITPVLSAKQALEKRETENFDAVISDYKMPDMDGIELLEELRKRENRIPFIILTGKGKEKEAIEALNKGADRYLKKEGKPTVLFDTLGRYIQEVIEERRKKEAHNALSKLLEEDKKLKSLERNSKKQMLPRSRIDASTLLNEHLDLIILGMLTEQSRSDDAIKSMTEEDLIEEIHRKFGIRVGYKALHTSVVKLKEEDIITDIEGRMTITPFYLR